jgi:hypothetical protein
VPALQTTHSAARMEPKRVSSLSPCCYTSHAAVSSSHASGTFATPAGRLSTRCLYASSSGHRSASTHSLSHLVQYGIHAKYTATAQSASVKSAPQM